MKPPCSLPNCYVADADAAVWNFLCELAVDPQALVARMQLSQQKQREEAADYQRQVDDLAELIAEREGDLSKLTLELLKHKEESPVHRVLTRQIAEYNELVEQLEAQRARLTARQRTRVLGDDDLARFTQILGAMPPLNDQWILEERQRAVALLDLRFNWFHTEEGLFVRIGWLDYGFVIPYFKATIKEEMSLNTFRSLKKAFNKPAPDQQERTPPGQYLTEKFPVLHYGDVPAYNDLEGAWDLRVWGEVASPKTFSFAEFRALPTTHITTDIHCVTRWSKLDTNWEGVQFKEFLKHIPALKPEGHFILFHCEQGFTANVPLEVMLEDDALLAYKYEGAELTPEHGFPLRALAPKKYFWKSAKWLRGIEFLSRDRLGFWERYGYNNHADPWQEERYSD